MQIRARENLKSVAFNALYFLGVQHILRNFKLRNQQLTILCFHRVSTDYDYFWDPIKPDDFEKLVKYLIKYYEIVSIEDAVKGVAGKRPKVILSFDDGYYDFYTHVLPIIKQYSLPVNHNIVTEIVNGRQDVIWTEKLNFLFNYLEQNIVDDALDIYDAKITINARTKPLNGLYIVVLKKLFEMGDVERETILTSWLNRYGLQVAPKKMMGWGEVRECVKYGVTFGSHTKTHTVLTSIKDAAQLQEELAGSKADIEKNLSVKVDVLAPPNGLCNQDVIEQARIAGYKYILGIGNHSSVQNNNGVTVLSRLNLISEPYTHMVLRVAELQSNLKRYGRV